MANPTQLTPQQIEHLIEVANDAMQKVQAEHALASGQDVGDIVSLFCQDYQQGKALLQMIAPLLAWWPAGGAIASIVLNALLAVGDQLYAQGCETQPPTS